SPPPPHPAVGLGLQALNSRGRSETRARRSSTRSAAGPAGIHPQAPRLALPPPGLLRSVSRGRTATPLGERPRERRVLGDYAGRVGGMGSPDGGLASAPALMRPRPVREAPAS